MLALQSAFGFLALIAIAWLLSEERRALPLILVMSALSALLFHWRVLPAVVRAFAAVLEKAMGVGGAVGLSTAANIFVGMVEAPLIVKPARIAVVSQGGGSEREHKARYAHCGNAPALIPGAQAWPGEITGGLNFLSFAVQDDAFDGGWQASKG